MLKKSLIVKIVIVVMVMALTLFLIFSNSYEKNYMQASEIDYPFQNIQQTPFDQLYFEIVDGYYQLENYNVINLNRYKDSAMIEVDFNDKVTYEDVNAAGQFCHDLFVKGRGSLIVSAGSMSGYQKKLYDEDYKFWDNVYFALKVNDKIIYQAFFTLDSDEELLLENEYIDLESNLFALKENQIKRFTNLAELTQIGECSYYRNVFANRLYIDIYNDKFLSGKGFKQMTDMLDSAFTNLDEELMFYYNGSYPKIIVRFRDKEGTYYEKTLVSNVSDGFK